MKCLLPGVHFMKVNDFDYNPPNKTSRKKTCGMFDSYYKSGFQPDKFGGLYRIARHDEQRGHLKALEFWAQTVGIVEAIHIDRLLRAGHDVHRDVVVASVLEDDKASVHVLEDQV